MPQLRTSLQELTDNPSFIANNVQYDAVAVMAEDKPLFYCISEREFLQFLALKQVKEEKVQPTNATQKKSIRDFAGILKNKTSVRLTIDELNEAIAEAGTDAGMQGLS